MLSFLFRLGEIAAIGSICVLFVHAITHIGHLRLIKRTGASRVLVWMAALLCLAAAGLALALAYVAEKSSNVFFILVSFLVFALVAEVLLRKLNKREVRPRID